MLRLLTSFFELISVIVASAFKLCKQLNDIKTQFWALFFGIPPFAISLVVFLFNFLKKVINTNA